jgi:hypothetical protein
MPKSKNKKDHKKRVAVRNKKIADDRKRIQKIQQDFLMKMIDQEKNKGLFNNLPNIDPVVGGEIGIDGPII